MTLFKVRGPFSVRRIGVVLALTSVAGANFANRFAKRGYDVALVARY